MIKGNNDFAIVGLRAAIAVFLAAMFGQLTHSVYPFWATFIALVLTTQTVGEGVFLASARIITTLVACSLATLFLQWFLPSQPVILIIIALALFLFVGYLQTHFWWAMLALGVLIAFFLTLLHRWSWGLFLTRVDETIVGALIAVMVTLLLRPRYAKDSAQEQLFNIFQQITVLLKTVLQLSNSRPMIASDIHRLVGEVTLFEKNLQMSRYEKIRFWHRDDNLEIALGVRRVQEAFSHINDALGRISDFPQQDDVERLLKQSQQQLQVAIGYRDDVEQQVDVECWQQLQQHWQVVSKVYTGTGQRDLLLVVYYLDVVWQFLRLRRES